MTRPKREKRGQTVTKGANPSRWVKDWLQKGIRPEKSDEIAYKEHSFLLLAGCSVLGLKPRSNSLNRTLYWHIENPEKAKDRDELTDIEMEEWDHSKDIPGNYEIY